MIGPMAAVAAVLVVGYTDNVGDRSDEITCWCFSHNLCYGRVLPSEVATLLIFSPGLTQVTSVWLAPSPLQDVTGPPVAGRHGRQRTDEHSRSGGLQIQMG